MEELFHISRKEPICRPREVFATARARDSEKSAETDPKGFDHPVKFSDFSERLRALDCISYPQRCLRAHVEMLEASKELEDR